jgi:hypothetical protein
MVVRADILVTKSGSRWEGTITDKGDHYEVVIPNGSKMTFPKSAVQEVQISSEPKRKALPVATGDAQAPSASETNLPAKDKPGQAAMPVENLESAIREIEQAQTRISEDKNLTTAQRLEATAKAEDRLRKTFGSRLWIAEAQVSDVIPGRRTWELALTVAGKQVLYPADIDKDKALSLHKGDKLTVYVKIGIRDLYTWQVTGVFFDAPHTAIAPTPAETAIAEWVRKLDEAERGNYTDVERTHLRSEADSFIRRSLGTKTFTLSARVMNVREVSGTKNGWLIGVGPITNTGLRIWIPHEDGSSNEFLVSMTQDEALKIKRGDVLELETKLAPKNARGTERLELRGAVLLVHVSVILPKN